MERKGHFRVPQRVDSGARRVSREKGMKKAFKKRNSERSGTGMEHIEVWQFTSSTSGWAGVRM